MPENNPKGTNLDLENKFKNVFKELNNLANLAESFFEALKTDEPQKPKNNVLYSVVEPEIGQYYWCINRQNTVDRLNWENYSFDLVQFNLNNVFLTKEKAQKQADRLKLLAEIQRFADLNNEVIDWINLDNSHIKKYFIAFDVDLECWITRFNTCYLNLGITYFSSENLANQALEKFKDRLDILLD